MAITEIINGLKVGFQDELSHIEAKRENVIGKVEQVGLLEKEIADKDIQAEQDKKTYGDERYAQGVLDGKGSVVLPNPDDPAAQFTQADMDRVYGEGKKDQELIMQPMIDELGNQVSSLSIANQELSTKNAELEAKIQELQAKADEFAGQMEIALAEQANKIAMEIEDTQIDNMALVAKYKMQPAPQA